MNGTAAERIETRLRECFRPEHLELKDDSARHAGHRGASSGGGHFLVLIVSDEFEGLELLDRHRRVNEALEGLFGEAIHALGLKTLTPTEWRGRR